jgi:putative membrane protein
MMTRSLFREVKNTLPDDPHLGNLFLQIAFAHSRMALRRQPQAEQLSRYLSARNLRLAMDSALRRTG